MTRAEYLFVIVWIINFIISVLYYLWGALFYVPARERQDKNEEEYLHDNRRTYLIRVIVMVLCPIVGPLFFLVSHLIYMTIFRQEVDLDDVIFSKERVKTNVKADEERERNLVPIEEALAVSDKKNLRMLMLNVIRGDLQDSLESISLALNSEDSETSHYAASVLRDELNDFRVTVQKIYTDIHSKIQFDGKIILVGSKYDKRHDAIIDATNQVSLLKSVAKTIPCARIITSAKENEGIQNLKKFIKESSKDMQLYRQDPDNGIGVKAFEIRSGGLCTLL